MYLYRQNYTIINQNRRNHIPLNVKFQDDLKRSLDGSLKKQYFSRHADTNHQNRVFTLSKNYNYGGTIQLFDHAQFIGVPPLSRTITYLTKHYQNFLFCGVWDSSVDISENIGQCQVQNFHFSRYLIGGSKVL